MDKLNAFVAIPSVLEDGVVVYDGPDKNDPRIRFVAISRRVNIGGMDFS